MTNDLQKYPISPQHIAAVRASGFDMADVDARHPVRNPLAEHVLAAKQHQPAKDPRAQHLLQDRAKGLERSAGRALGVLAGLVATLSAKPVGACGDHPTACPEAPSFLAQLMARLPDLNDPIWIGLLLSGLLGGLLAQIWVLSCHVSHPHHTGFAMSRNRKRRHAKSPKQADFFKDNNLPHKKADDAEAAVSDGPVQLTAPTPKYRWVTSGASRKGLVRTENQDAFRLFHTEDDTACLILCDGAGGVAGGKLAAELAASVLEKQFKVLLETSGTIDSAQLEGPIRAARRAVDHSEAAGITTAIIAILQQDQMHYATLGDGALTIIWPDGMVNQVMTPHHQLGQPSNVICAYIGDHCQIPARTGSLRIEPDCTVIAMSDGASDLFPYEAYAEERAAYSAILNREDDPDLANVFLKQLEDARDPDTDAYLHHDNMTLLLAHCAASAPEKAHD